MTIGAWEKQDDPVDEIEFTPWAEPGWLAHNGMSPEIDVCAFFATLVRLMKPSLVVETGVGQGYMTRAIVPHLSDGQMLMAYESDDQWRDRMKPMKFWGANKTVAKLDFHVSPTPDTLTKADLCFFDSDFEFRLREIALWWEYTKPRAVAVIHDTGDRHGTDTPHTTVKETIIGLGVTGFFLRNPRGCFVAVKP